MSWDSATRSFMSATDSKNDPSAKDITKAIFVGLTALLIISGNAFCLIVLRLIKDTPIVSRIFMASLTFADLLNGLLVILPVTVSSVFNAWPLIPDIFCYIDEIVNSVISIITILCLFVVSIDRYIAVSRPLRYETIMTTRRSIGLIVLAWFIPCVTRLVLTPYKEGYDVEFRTDSDMCWLSPDQPIIVIYSVILFLYILVPFGATCAIYTKLFLLARRHNRCIAAQPSESRLHRRRPVSQFRANTKSALTFFLLTVTFAISWTPFLISYLYRIITQENPPELIVILIQLSSFSNGWINCLVYYFRNKVFKRTVKELHHRALIRCGCRRYRRTVIVNI